MTRYHLHIVLRAIRRRHGREYNIHCCAQSIRWHVRKLQIVNYDHVEERRQQIYATICCIA